MVELNRAGERCLIEMAGVEWRPMAPGVLVGMAEVFDRLGDHAAIARQPAPVGHIYTVTGHRAGVAWAGQGGSIGEALPDIRAIA